MGLGVISSVHGTRTAGIVRITRQPNSRNVQIGAHILPAGFTPPAGFVCEAEMDLHHLSRSRTDYSASFHIWEKEAAVTDKETP